ncbi:hypothetical protein AKJ16_DCAP18214 [Drosera capensis]
MIENRTVLSRDDDLDGFDKRKLPSPRFQLEIVMADYDDSIHGRPRNDRSFEKSVGGANPNATRGNSANGIATVANQKRGTKKEDTDDVFSDSYGEGGTSRVTPGQNSPASDHTTNHHVADVTRKAARLSMGSNEPSQATTNSSAHETINGSGTMDFKAIVADASVFSFGDEDEYERE